MQSTEYPKVPETCQYSVDGKECAYPECDVRCMIQNDPIHEDDDGWYFWDETWAYRYGPYNNREAARIKLEKYLETLQEG